MFSNPASGALWSTIIMGVIGVLGWLLKQSIYGKLEEIEDRMDRELDKVSNTIEKLKIEHQSVGVCLATRAGCQNLLIAKMDALRQQLEKVIENQEHLIGRFETHINGNR